MIDDSCLIGSGVIMTSNLTLGNNVQIGANSLVNNTFNQNDILIAGSPALVRKQELSHWWGTQRIYKIEQLKKSMNLDI